MLEIVHHVTYQSYRKCGISYKYSVYWVMQGLYHQQCLRPALDPRQVVIPIDSVRMDFSEMSQPSFFDDDPHLAWAFWKFRHDAYTLGRPHDGYRLLAEWGQRMKHGCFSVTSNIDGHWERTEGIGETKVYECHGALTRMQRVDDPWLFSGWLLGL